MSVTPDMDVVDGDEIALEYDAANLKYAINEDIPHCNPPKLL